MADLEPVVISAIMLSDHVIVEHGTQKKSLIGIFSQWNPPGLPFQTPPFYITAFLTNFQNAGGDAIDITTRIEEVGNGHTLASASAKLKFPDPQNIPREALAEVPFRIGGITFSNIGTFKVVVLVNGEVVGQRFFAVTPPPTSISTQQTQP